MPRDPRTDAPSAPGAGRAGDTGPLDIALVVNMPDAAQEATERQFRSVVEEAAGDIAVRVRLYALPEVPRGEQARRHISRSYADISDLWSSRVDGLIVTGTEPQSADIVDEPYWGSLTRLVDWADRHSYASVWSCLAAHAVVRHLDGIHRRRLDDKCFGIFDCDAVCEHPLTAGGPPTMRMPHSRWNDLPEDALSACGYRVLMRSPEAGVGAFIREQNSLFVFFQGHPEYEAISLLLEYRRDVRRFLRGERDTFPPYPRGYFDDDTLEALARLRQRALSDRRESLIDDLPTAALADRLANTWRPAATCLYRNWLRYISSRKAQALAAT